MNKEEYQFMQFIINKSTKMYTRIMLQFKYTFMIAIVLLSSCSNEISLSELAFDNDRNGCGNFIVYTLGDNNTSLSVQGNKELLGISTTKQEFELPNENIEISINKFESEIGDFYCDDVIGNEGTILNQYFATSGIAEIQITRDSIQFDGIDVIYEITIMLKDIEFEIDGDLKIFEQVDFNDITVGWLPG